MWVKLDDGFFHHHKTMQLSVAAKLLFVAGLTHCASQLTDGFISTGAARATAGLIGVPAGTAKQLVEVGLWHKCQDGYDVHDYLQYQMSAEQVRVERDAAAARVQRWRQQKNGTRNPVGNAVTPPVTNGETTPVSNGVSTAAPIPKPSKELSSSSTSPPPRPAADDDDEVLKIVTDRRILATTRRIDNPARYRATVEHQVRAQYAERLADAPPGHSAEALADWLEPPPQPKPAAPRRVDPTEATAAAAKAIMARNALPDCPNCDNTGWVDGDPANSKCATCKRLL